MKRIFLVPVAVTALFAATSMAQAAPAPSALGSVKSAAAEQAGTTQVHYRYYYRYYHHRHHHHHHRHHHRHHRHW
jgi:hypothetical protein